MLDKRMVGHDAFVRFILQYFFLNNAVMTGEIPQWIPFLTHGTLSPILYISQTTILQNIFLLLAPLLKDINFFYLFHFSVFWDKLLLLIGVWLFTKHYFSSASTRAFVTIAVTGSCIWVSQADYNLYFYYAVPLILYFLHKFFDTGKWGMLFIAGNLLFLQALSTSVYFLPATSFVIFLYLIFYFLFNKNVFLRNLSNIPFNGFAVLTLIFIVLPFSVLYILLTTNQAHMVIGAPERNLDGTVSLNTFLTYGIFPNLSRWWELILGLSWNFDCSLYIGLFSLPFIVIGILFQTNKKSAPILCLIIMMLLFSQGTFVSRLAYYFWPFMKYFRHLANTAVFIKIFLCFIAGFGFDYVFHHEKSPSKQKYLSFAVISISILLVWLSFLFSQMAHNESFLNHFNFLHYLNPVLNQHIFTKTSLPRWFNLSAIFAFMSSVFLISLLIFKDKKSKTLLLPIAILCQAINVYCYNIHTTYTMTSSLSAKHENISQFQNMPYAARRSNNSVFSAKRAAFLTSIPHKHYYNLLNMFLFHDEVVHSLRTNTWLRPLDKLNKAYLGQSTHEAFLPSDKIDKSNQLVFPLRHPAAGKIAGFSEDKIQFFNGAYETKNDEEIASLLSHKNYSGDILFLSPLHNKQIKSSNIRPWTKENPLASNQRLHFPYQITRFDSNNIEISIDTGELSNVWMMYSDVWHPSWQATINDQSVSVSRGNLAYKAIPLKAGINNIHLRFTSFRQLLFQSIVGVNSLFWTGLILWLLWRICRNSLKRQALS